MCETPIPSPTDAYMWLYTPFLLEAASSDDYDLLAKLDKRFNTFKPCSNSTTWQTDFDFVYECYQNANDICAEGEVFIDWIEICLKNNPDGPLSEYYNNFDKLEHLSPTLRNQFIDTDYALHVITKITSVMDVVPIFEKFDEDSRFSTIVDRIRPLIETESSLFLDWKIRSIIILDLLTFENPPNFCWYVEFLRVLSEASDTTKPIACFLNPNFEKIIKKYDTTVSKVVTIQTEKDTNFAPAEEPDGPRPQSDFEKETYDKHPENNFQLRNYQFELANKVFDKGSSIICAPTGSGKTIIAAHIIREHLRHLNNLKQVCRAVMFVPTILLAEQQAKVLRTLFGEEFYVTLLCGIENEINNDNGLDVLAADVIVMTPQAFINRNHSPLARKKIYVRDFTLMVFDECHHCDKRHPYNVIMRNILKLRETLPSKPTPLIVGLTASVGIGALSIKTDDGNAAVNHIMGLCARMGVNCISSVKDAKNLNDLKQVVPKPIDDFITVGVPIFDKYAYALAQLADQIQKELDPFFASLFEHVSNFKFEKFPTVQLTGAKNGSSKTSHLYLHRLTKYISYFKQSKLSDFEKQMALWLLDYLQVFYNTLRYNEIFPALASLEYFRFAQDDIRNQMSEMTRANNPFTGKAESIYGMIQQTIINFENEGLVRDAPDKSALSTLMNEIQKQYERNPTSRILIFVDLRRGAFDLGLYLKCHPNIIATFGKNKVTTLMSCNKSKESFIVPSRAQQVEHRRDFDEGRVNIVVSTSVCEEGVDVSACNLVIKYNSVGNDISYIQRRGRARAENSRSVLIALGSDTEKREYYNIYRECIMDRCLLALAEMDDATIQRHIAEEHVRQVNSTLFDEHRLTTAKPLMDCSIRCKGCDVRLGSTESLRLLDDESVVLYNPSIWEKVDLDPMTKNRNDFSTAYKYSWANCIKCKTRWGAVVKYADCFFLMPRLDGIVIEELSEMLKGHTNEKWSTLIRTHIRILPIKRTELVLMYNSTFDPQALKTVAQKN